MRHPSSCRSRRWNDEETPISSPNYIRWHTARTHPNQAPLALPVDDALTILNRSVRLSICPSSAARSTVPSAHQHLFNAAGQALLTTFISPRPICLRTPTRVKVPLIYETLDQTIHLYRAPEEKPGKQIRKSDQYTSPALPMRCSQGAAITTHLRITLASSTKPASWPRLEPQRFSAPTRRARHSQRG